MPPIFESLQTYLFENWPELVWIVAAAATASYLAGRRNRSLWLKRSFLDRLNVSLNSVTPDGLRIRTILETDVESVFLNRSAAKTVTDLARSTTPEDPIIPVPRDDCWYYLNSVLNEVSERFSDGFIRDDAGIASNRVTYLICLTCEQAGTVRTHKIRAMLIQKSVLENLPETCPPLEHESHRTRWETLQILAHRWSIAPHYFLEMELVL
ncbi:MAG: hypothetical protein ACE361_15955 [Aureliella sp.]